DSHLMAIYDALTPVVDAILLARGHEDLIRHPHGAACNCPCSRGAATPCRDDYCPIPSHFLYHDELETKQ
ncbi:MAG: hypothetical protein NUW01_09970, partial [Gemmatimonadaceae bacterium]|nr:hypothetical protein [Gemmatimonadaceae bacterium]